MGRRIEVELTSTREDGSWTWRAAGARQPKGELVGSLLYDGAKVGDVVKVEAEFHVDGIEVTEVFAPKQKRERSDLLEMKTRQFRDDELVTTQRVSRDDRRGNRRNRRDRDGRRGRRDEGERQPRPQAETRPKPKRLRPRRAHRDALLSAVGEEHRPIVEQVIRDGMPGVRAAIDKQNAEAKEAGKPEVDAAPILAIAEQNLTKARLAEWRDRADAALADTAELDLRDLRSVVVSGNDIARDDESREIAEQLKAALDARVESDHTTWLADMESAIAEGRVVRALRLSSRPVKAGAPLPPELASSLAAQTSEALAPDIGQERWATVLDALAYSPVRGAVTPLGVPPEPKEDLLDAVKRLSDRIPTIAGLFGIDPASVPRSAKRRRPPRRDGANKGKGGRGRDNNGRGGGNQAPSRPHPGAEPKAEAEPEAPAEDNEPVQDDQPAAESTVTEAPQAETEPAPTPETETPEAEPALAETAPTPEAEAAQAETAPTPEAEAPEAEPTEAEAAQAETDPTPETEATEAGASSGEDAEPEAGAETPQPEGDPVAN